MFSPFSFILSKYWFCEPMQSKIWPTASKKLPIEFCSSGVNPCARKYPLIEAIMANSFPLNLDKKFAIFKDEKGEFHIVEIYINMGQCVMLNSKNQQGEDTRIHAYIFSS